MTLIVPSDKATGCLPRASTPGQWCPLVSDRLRTIPVGEWPERIAAQESTRPLVWKILDQGRVGSCATEAIAQDVHVMRRLAGLADVELNPWFVYNTTSGGRDQGSSIDTNLRFVRDHGIAPTRIWPRSKGWQARPSAEAISAALDYRIEEFFDIGSIVEFGSSLLRGFPVQFGWSGHSVLALELISPTRFLYVNSWGAAWGDRGFGTLRLSEVNFNYGAFCGRQATYTNAELQAAA